MQNLQTPLNTREMRSNRIEIASFSEELQKNHPAAGGEAPTTPSVARFSYTTVVYSTHLSIQTFSLYICWFKISCNAIRRFFMRENLSRKAVTHTKQDSLAAIAFGKSRCRVSNTCDLRCRLYFCATRCNNRSRP